MTVPNKGVQARTQVVEKVGYILVGTGCGCAGGSEDMHPQEILDF